MILKGRTVQDVAHARELARHLQKDENDIIEVWHSSQANDPSSIEPELVDMQLMTQLTRGKTGIFQVAISPEPGQPMDRAKWERSIEAIAELFGLEDQPYITIYHHKDGRDHLHVCWSLVNEHERIIQLGWFGFKLHELGEELEREFGHKLVNRVKNNRSFEVTDADRMRKARTGKNPLRRKQLITQIWEGAQTTDELVDRLRVNGYRLGKGDKCRFAIMDRDGEVYNLVRQLPKTIKTKDVAERLKGLELEQVTRHKPGKTKRRGQVNDQLKRIQQKRKDKQLFTALKRELGNGLVKTVSPGKAAYNMRQRTKSPKDLEDRINRTVRQAELKAWLASKGYRLNKGGQTKIDEMTKHSPLYLLMSQFDRLIDEKKKEIEPRELSNSGQHNEQQIDWGKDQDRGIDRGRDL